MRGLITFKQTGDFSKTTRFLNTMSRGEYLTSQLDKYGRIGVDALSRATPVDTGKTAESWDYKIEQNDKGVKIVWTNENTTNQIPIVILIEYGHATKNGGFVQGREFINPTMQPIFDELSERIWKEVTNA